MAEPSLSMEYILLAKSIHCTHFINEETEATKAKRFIQGPATLQDHICPYLFRSELLSLLKTYNCYHEGRSSQLRHREVRPPVFCYIRSPFILAGQKDFGRSFFGNCFMPVNKG